MFNHDILKVLHNMRSSRGPQMSEYVIIPDEDDSDQDGEIILVPYGKTKLFLSPE